LLHPKQLVTLLNLGFVLKGALKKGGNTALLGFGGLDHESELSS
jgi:hypothetical protein